MKYPPTDLVFVLFQSKDHLPADQTVIIAILMKGSDLLNNGKREGKELYLSVKSF